MLSWFVYTLAVIDFLLVSSFFYGLSTLSEQALQASPHIDISFWVDYTIWVIITIFIPAYLYYFRYDAEDVFANHFNINNKLHRKIIGAFFGKVLPVIGLITMFIRASSWMFFGSGPGDR